MNSVKIASLNASNAFSEGNEAFVAKFMQEVNPDIFFTSEAYAEGDSKALTLAQETCRSLGYLCTTADYDYSTYRPGKHGFMAAVRQDRSRYVEIEFVRAGNINALETETMLTSGTLRAFGVHLNDRSNDIGEQLEPLICCSNISPTEPVAIFGDMNDAHREDRVSGILRSGTFELLTKLGGKIIPDSIVTSERLLDIQQRLQMMAEGNRTAFLESLGFRDVDPTHQPTIPSQKPIVQLDRFMVTDSVMSSEFELHRDVSIQGKFTPSVLEHVGISAVLAIAE